MVALLLLTATLFIHSTFGVESVPEPAEYILSFPTIPNPLNITVDTVHPENNYIILLGDWGCAGQDTVGVKMQTCIANHMINFVNNQSLKGMNLLFIGTMGDNFYPAGQSCIPHDPGWGFPFYNKYGILANNTIWLTIKGNHDWANLDPNAMCPWSNPKYIDPITKIPYAGLQLNKNKGGCNPDNFYLPDYGYFYSIPELKFEWIAVEETVTDCSPNDKGFYTFDGCGNDNNGTVGCNFLGKMRDASENMMKQRAMISNNSNFLIVNHYEAQTQTMLLNEFDKARNGTNGIDYIAWSAAGHAHIQQCITEDSDNKYCSVILSGGGGTGSTNDLHGFFVIGFDENSQMTQPYKINDPTISCDFTKPGACGCTFSDQEIEQNNMYCSQIIN